MPNQYSAEKKTIGELLSLTSPRITVPDFQRSYSWDVPSVDIFWQDLVNFSDQYPGKTIDNQEYFLGSIVLVDAGSESQLLDGQQRLATATIMLSVMRDFLTQFRGDAGVRITQKYVAEIDDATNTTAYKLTLNRYDRDFFRREIQDGPDPEAPERPTMKSDPAPVCRTVCFLDDHAASAAAVNRRS